MSKRQRYKYVADGERFFSLKEGKRFLFLKRQQEAGNISRLSLKVTFPIFFNETKITTYRAEFVYYDSNDRMIVEDCKENRTPLYRIRKKLLEAINGIEIVEI